MKLTNHYRERLINIRHRYKGRSVGFRSDRIRLPNGHHSQRDYLTHPGAVGVLAFERPDSIILVKQYRYPVGEFTYEIPAGKLSPGENPMHCVRRELEEETGFRARRFTKLARFWPTAAFATEVIHLYVAQGLTAAQAHPDDDEFLELVRVSPKQIERMIRTGRIRDSKTIIAYLLWKTGRTQRTRATR